MSCHSLSNRGEAMESKERKLPTHMVAEGPR